MADLQGISSPEMGLARLEVPPAERIHPSGLMRERLSAIRSAIREFVPVRSAPGDEMAKYDRNRMLEIYEDFVETILDGDSDEGTISTKTRDIIIYINLHSSVVVHLMAQLEYPEVEVHRLRHRWFLKETTALMEDIQSGFRMHEHLASLLGDLLLIHLRDRDKDFSNYIASC